MHPHVLGDESQTALHELGERRRELGAGRSCAGARPYANATHSLYRRHAHDDAWVGSEQDGGSAKHI